MRIAKPINSLVTCKYLQHCAADCAVDGVYIIIKNESLRYNVDGDSQKRRLRRHNIIVVVASFRGVVENIIWPQTDGRDSYPNVHSNTDVEGGG